MMQLSKLIIKEQDRYLHGFASILEPGKLSIIIGRPDTAAGITLKEEEVKELRDYLTAWLEL